MIYFIQAGNDGPIKIGYAQNSSARRRELQTGNHEELNLITEIPGGKDREDTIHNDLRSYRYRGEWFRATSAVLAYIDKVAQVEYEPIDGIEIAVIWRSDSEPFITDYCPFCGERHYCNGEDGWTEVGCFDQSLWLFPRVVRTAADGTVLKQSDGYIVRTRECKHFSKHDLTV